MISSLFFFSQSTHPAGNSWIYGAVLDRYRPVVAKRKEQVYNHGDRNSVADRQGAEQVQGSAAGQQQHADQPLCRSRSHHWQTQAARAGGAGREDHCLNIARRRGQRPPFLTSSARRHPAGIGHHLAGAPGKGPFETLRWRRTGFRAPGQCAELHFVDHWARSDANPGEDRRLLFGEHLGTEDGHFLLTGPQPGRRWRYRY
jgi:hypothetical protein